MVASGLRVAGAGLGVGIAGRRCVIGDFLQCGLRTEMAAESSCGEETAGMTPMKPRSWGLFREKQVERCAAAFSPTSSGATPPV